MTGQSIQNRSLCDKCSAGCDADLRTDHFATRCVCACHDRTEELRALIASDGPTGATVGKCYEVLHACIYYEKGSPARLRACDWRVAECIEIFDGLVAYFRCECRGVVTTRNDLILREVEPATSVSDGQ